MTRFLTHRGMITQARSSKLEGKRKMKNERSWKKEGKRELSKREKYRPGLGALKGNLIDSSLRFLRVFHFAFFARNKITIH